MIIVREDENGQIARIGGNPVLMSRDGECKARLRVILHESWSTEERVVFGVHLVEPAAVPDGKRIDGAVSFTHEGDKIVTSAKFRDAPTPAATLARERAEAALEAWASGMNLTLADVRAVLLRKRAGDSDK